MADGLSGSDGLSDTRGPSQAGGVGGLSEAVCRAVAAGGGAAVLALARAHRGPIVEPGRMAGTHDVTFVYLDRQDTVRAVGLFCPAIPGAYAVLRSLAGGVFAATFPLPAATRTRYHFCPDPPAGADTATLVALSRSPTARRIDHFNPHVDEVRLGGLRLRMVESLLTLPGAPVGPPHTATPGVPAGEPLHLSIRSAALRRRKDIVVHRPPAGTPAGPLVLMFQGNDEWRPAALLDNLVASGRVPPFVAVQFVEPSLTARLRDFTSGAEHDEFVSGELLPLLHREAGLDTTDVVVAGYSAGAVAAASLCLHDPGRFARLATVSGALYLAPGTRFWRDEGSTWLTERYRAAPALPRRAYLAAGWYEDLWRQDVYTHTATLAGILTARGVTARFDTGPTGHDAVTARAYLAEALAFLLAG